MTDTAVNNVSTPRPEYKTYLPTWELVEDAVAGAAAIKAQTVKYLPKPNPKDISEENRVRYEQYLLRAVYYNATGRTLKALLGLAFNTPPEIELASALDYLEEDCNGSGVSLAHVSQQLLAEVLKAGRVGILVDYPQTDGMVSRAQQQSGDVRALICMYGASDIINWRTTTRAGKTLLSMVVLREGYEVDSGWVPTVKSQYRVLRLSPEGYTTEVWRQDTARPEDWVLFQGPTVVLDGAGQPWQEIPFTFIGAEDNDDDIDGSPLYDLATLNLAHFRNSADFEDSVYFVGQPTVYVTGLTESWRDDLQKDGFYFGSRAWLPLPMNASAGMLQAEANTLARIAMQDKEAQMAALGARLLLVGGAVKTATQQRSEDAAAHSVLTLCCNNVSAAITKALAWCAQFERLDAGTDMYVRINTEFDTDVLDAPTLVALLQMVQAGKLPESDFWAQLKDVGLIAREKSDEDIREEIDQQQPQGGGSLFGTQPGKPDPEEPTAEAEDEAN